MKLLGNLTNQDKTVFQTSSDNKAVTITPTTTLTGASLTLTLPNPAGTTDTLVSRTSTDTLTNKTLTTPVLGVATATSINKVTITAPATSATLTIADGKTLTANSSMTLTGTDGKALSLAGNLTTSGSSDVTFTFSGATNVTFPTSGTLAANTAATPTVAGIVTTYVPVVASAIKSVSSANYTILTADGYDIILVSTGAADRTITLPAASENGGRVIRVKKTDAGAGTVIITRAGSDTIDANTTRVLSSQYDSISLGCDGSSNWPILDVKVAPLTQNNNGVGTTAAASGSTVAILGGNGISLTPGVWLLSGTADMIAEAGTSQNFTQNNQIVISATSGSGTGVNAGDDYRDMQTPFTNAEISTGGGLASLSVVDFKVTVASTTTYYLNATAGYGGTAPTWYGKLVGKMVG